MIEDRNQGLTQDNLRLQEQCNIEKIHQDELQMLIGNLREDLRLKDEQIEELEEELLVVQEPATTATQAVTPGGIQRMDTRGRVAAVNQ